MTLTPAYGGPVSPEQTGIQSGFQFVATFTQLAVATDGMVDLMIQTADFDIELELACIVSAQAQFFMFEAPIFSDAGFAVPNSARFRQKLSTPSGVVTHSPALISNGNQLINTFLPGGVRSQAVGSFTTGEAGWPLARNTAYLLRVENLGATIANITIGLSTTDLGAS